MPEIIVLFDGYSTKLPNGSMDANCTCTLIKSTKLIIVDTMTAWDREKIVHGIKIVECIKIALYHFNITLLRNML